jgi:tetratricopeptide (TPR) repeat protein
MTYGTRRISVWMIAGAVALGACERERPPLPGTEAKSEAGRAAVSQGAPMASPGMAPAAAAVEQGQALALKLEGIGSKVELDHALAKLPDEETRAHFEAGFRSCFVNDPSLRDYPAALAVMERLLQQVPDFAPAYRTMAYAKLNTGFDMAGATALYEKAIQVDPNYGEAHYALSFMLTQFDPERGRTHFDKAMELGIPDERNLQERFYP